MTKGYYLLYYPLNQWFYLLSYVFILHIQFLYTIKAIQINKYIILKQKLENQLNKKEFTTWELKIMNNIKNLLSRKRILAFGIGAAIIYPQINSQFELYYSDTKLNQFIKSKCNEIQKGYFLPTPYLGYGILQAVFGSKSQFRHEKINYEKKYIDFGDYGELRYDVAKLQDDSIIPIEKREKNKNTCLVILLGITASSQEPYVENMTAEALKEGYTVVLYNDRLYNNYEDKGRIFPREGYYSIEVDFEKTLSQIQKDFSGYNFYAVGHSFGANTLVKYLGSHKNDNPFKGAVSVGNPFDIKQAFATLRPTFDKYLVESRQAVLKMRQSLLQNPPPHININLEKALKAVNTTEFDEHFSKHLYGHKTIFDYYEDLSCINQLKNVQIPLLCLNSKDDPCIHHSTIPFKISEINQNVMLLVTKCGGHVGWFEGIFTPKRWYMKPTLEFLNALTEYPGSQL
ncbi:hypothetical protein ABPG72_003134 [Tetrahymena utriculariae]